jgi:hypothetical protein
VKTDFKKTTNAASTILLNKLYVILETTKPPVVKKTMDLLIYI